MNQTRKEGNATVKLSDLIWRDHLSSYNSRAHSVRLNGMVTSIRLENVYWTRGEALKKWLSWIDPSSQCLD